MVGVRGARASSPTVFSPPMLSARGSSCEVCRANRQEFAYRPVRSEQTPPTATPYAFVLTIGCQRTRHTAAFVFAERCLDESRVTDLTVSDADSTLLQHCH